MPPLAFSRLVLGEEPRVKIVIDVKRRWKNRHPRRSRGGETALGLKEVGGDARNEGFSSRGTSLIAEVGSASTRKTVASNSNVQGMSLQV